MSGQFKPPFHIAFDEEDSEELRAKSLINLWEKCRHENGEYPDDSDPSENASDVIKTEYNKWLESNDI